MIKNTLVAFIFIFSIFSGWANDNRDAAWLGLFHKKVLPQNYFLWTEAQLRYLLDSTGMQQTLYRFGALKKINEQHEVGLLYAYVDTEIKKEHRPTLQHGQRIGTIGSMLFSGRTRLEARFREDETDDSARFRYLLRGQQNIWEQVDLVVWNEAFINLTDDEWTGNRTYERNRFFIGARIPYFDINWEIGYMNQFIPRRNDVMEHIITAYLFY
jgi:hypothetical protein